MSKRLWMMVFVTVALSPVGSPTSGPNLSVPLRYDERPNIQLYISCFY